MRTNIDQLAQLLESRGRARSDVEVSVGTDPMGGPIDIEGYAKAGVEQLVVVTPPVESLKEVGPVLDHLAETVLRPAHDL
jgi:hypothetical protein